jgi:lysine-N-methylase
VPFSEQILMTLSVRNLPILQNWSCHSCSDCCRIETVVTEREKQRIEALDMAGDAEVAPGPWFERRGLGWAAQWVLRHRPDGTCVFLTAARRCRLQERFGAEAKPFVCRLFPFLLIPAGNHWRVGLRFACPSVSENRGRPMAEYDGEFARLALDLEAHVGRTGESATPPPLQAGKQVSWPDVLRLAQALMDIVQNRGVRLERRLRQCLALARTCRQARLDNLSGGKLTEFLKVMRTALDTEVPERPAELPPPGWIGRVLFRSLLAIYARKDQGEHHGPATGSRLGRMRSGWRFVRGRGEVPRVHALLPDTTFEEVAIRPALQRELDETLGRYYLVKLHSLQFCGPPNFGLPFWDGLASLMLTYPMIVWLARAFAHLGPMPAVQNAISQVDDHFGGNPILGSRLCRFYQRTLAERGELDRLVAWYSR